MTQAAMTYLDPSKREGFQRLPRMSILCFEFNSGPGVGDHHFTLEDIKVYDKDKGNVAASNEIARVAYAS